MRITSRMMMTEYNRNLNNNLNRMASLERQTSTGKRLSKPSDDPVGVITSLRLRTRMTETTKYISNIDDSVSWLNTSDSTMSEVDNVMQRVRELTVSAANGTQSAEAKNAISSEIKQLLEQMQTLANSAYSDKYIFGGTNYTEETFQDRIWKGNDRDVSLEIGTGVTVPVNTKMRSFFMGNNQYDIIHDRMPEGEFAASLMAGPKSRVDNIDPDIWTARVTSTSALFGGITGADITSNIPTPDGTTNIGASIIMEISEITYDNNDTDLVTGVKLNVAYRQHDSVTGISYDEVTPISLKRRVGTDIYEYTSPLVIGKGQVTIAAPIEVDTANAAFTDGTALGSRFMFENTASVGGTPLNLGATTTLKEPEWQRNQQTGTGLVMNNVIQSGPLGFPVTIAAGSKLNLTVDGVPKDIALTAGAYATGAALAAQLQTNFNTALGTGEVTVSWDAVSNQLSLANANPGVNSSIYLNNDASGTPSTALQLANNVVAGAAYNNYNASVLFEVSQSEVNNPIQSGALTLPLVVGAGTMNVTLNGQTKNVPLTTTAGAYGIGAGSTLAANLQADFNAVFGAGEINVTWSTDTNQLTIANRRTDSNSSLALNTDIAGTPTTTLQLTQVAPRVECKVRLQLVDKFTGEHKYVDTVAKVWLNTNGADNFVDIKEKLVKTAYQAVDNLIVPNGHSEAEYYDYKTMFQFSQLRLEEGSRFTVGDRFVLQVTPPLNSPKYEIDSGSHAAAGWPITVNGTMNMTINGENHDVPMTAATYNWGDGAVLATNLQNNINAVFGAGAVSVNWDTVNNKLQLVDNRTGDGNTILINADTGGAPSTTLKLTSATGALILPPKRDKVLEVTGPASSNPVIPSPTKEFVFSSETIEDSASLSLYGFYLDAEGNTKNSYLDIPVNALEASTEVVNWNTSSTYINKLTGDGLPPNYKFQVGTTRNGGATANPSLATMTDTDDILAATGSVAPDMTYNADIMMEVIDKFGTTVTMRMVSHETSKNGDYQSVTQDIVLDTAIPQTFTLGNVTISNMQLVPANQIAMNAKIVTHVTARNSTGDMTVSLAGTNDSDPSKNFTRNIVLNPDVVYPKHLNMSYFNVEDNGDWNSANIDLAMRGVGDGDTATFETGISFDTRDTGIFQIFRKLTMDLERKMITNSSQLESLDSDMMANSIYTEITGCLGKIDDKMSFLVNEQAQVGTRVTRLEMQKNRLTDINLTYTELLSNTEDADIAKVVTEMMAQEMVYKAALSTGAKILPLTLVDFMR